MDTLTDTGIYERLLAATDGCDSIIQLTLNVNANSFFEMQDIFCAGDIYSFLDINTSEAGIYQTTLPNAARCDSIITLNLTEINSGIGIEIIDNIIIDLGESIDLAPIIYDPIHTNFIWSDNMGNIISNEVACFNVPTSPFHDVIYRSL